MGGRSHARARGKQSGPGPRHVRALLSPGLWSGSSKVCRCVHGEHSVGDRLAAPSQARTVRENVIMRPALSSYAAGVCAMLVTLGSPALLPAADPDWKAVEQALGKSGQLQPGDVYRIGMPRTDLSVTVKGVPVKAGFALGSYAAFKQIGDHAMVMGDLVLLDQEVPAVMSALFTGGLAVTAVHNHLNEMSPHVMYMHFS